MISNTWKKIYLSRNVSEIVTLTAILEPLLHYKLNVLLE
jgi:hypothetical protein